MGLFRWLDRCGERRLERANIVARAQTERLQIAEAARHARLQMWNDGMKTVAVLALLAVVMVIAGRAYLHSRASQDMAPIATAPQAPRVQLRVSQVAKGKRWDVAATEKTEVMSARAEHIRRAVPGKNETRARPSLAVETPDPRRAPTVRTAEARSSSTRNDPGGESNATQEPLAIPPRRQRLDEPEEAEPKPLEVDITLMALDDALHRSSLVGGVGLDNRLKQMMSRRTDLLFLGVFNVRTRRFMSTARRQWRSSDDPQTKTLAFPIGALRELVATYLVLAPTK